MKLNDIFLKIISDSRGEDTVEAEITSGNFKGIASVPAGKSRGAHEAYALKPIEVLKKFDSVKSEILARDFETQKEFDDFLIDLDGTQNKENLGGNLILSLSLAWARMKAESEGKELYEYIRELTTNNQQPTTFPKPIFNVINGGAHAKNNLSFQEFQVIPEVSDFGMALGLGEEYYEKLRETLEGKFGKENISLGDEAGYSAPFKSNEEALDMMAELIAKQNYPLRIGLDTAATQFYKEGLGYFYRNKYYNPEEMKNHYLDIIERYNILSIEDPFYEEDFEQFAKLSQNITQNGRKALVITDDLTTTNKGRLEAAIKDKSGNAILVKLNQIGSLSETLEVVKTAYENNWQVVVSHRSGETIDSFIADLAVAVSAWGIKSGAPATPERMAKYNRILEIWNSK